MGGLHRWAVGQLPSHKGGYTLDLDSWALLHEDGHQQGVAVGYTRRGLKPGYRFQGLITNQPGHQTPLEVWRSYNGRADIENRIKELGEQFGIKRLACESFWATEAIHHLAITAYNLCVLLQRRLGQMGHCQLQTLRWRLFSCAAVWSQAQGKPHLRMAVQGDEQRAWWREILAKLGAPPNCNAVGSFAA